MDTFWAHSAQSQMALLTNRLDLCIQGLFGAGKSKSMAILILALLELDVDHRLKILFLCKENSGTRSFADLLQWLDPPEAVLKRLGRLVGDQERNKSSIQLFLYEIRHQPKRTKTNAWKVSIGHGHRWHGQSRSHHAVVNHEWLYARPFPDGNRRRSAVRNLTERLPQSAPHTMDWRCTTNPRRSRPCSAQCKTIPTVTPCQTTRPQKQQEIFYAVNLGRSYGETPRKHIQ